MKYALIKVCYTENQSKVQKYAIVAYAPNGAAHQSTMVRDTMERAIMGSFDFFHMNELTSQYTKELRTHSVIFKFRSHQELKEEIPSAVVFVVDWREELNADSKYYGILKDCTYVRSTNTRNHS